MAEWKFFDDSSWVSTAEYHKDRERAPHLEQPAHRHRLHAARDLIHSIPNYRNLTLSDLGCGDGGLLQLLKEDDMHAWGYDFCPANAAGWTQRGVLATQQDWIKECRVGNIVVMTEVLEHLENPHAILRNLTRGDYVQWLVVSSPHNEGAHYHADEHSWAWDYDGYEKLLTDAGWKIATHILSLWSQLILARRT